LYIEYSDFRVASELRLTGGQDNSPAEIRRLIALLLTNNEPSHNVLLAVQHLTNVLICRLDTCSLVRANGAALIGRMRHFLEREQDMHASSRNDFFYAMMWMWVACALDLPGEGGGGGRNCSFYACRSILHAYVDALFSRLQRSHFRGSFDPAVGASDPNLQVLLSHTGFFVEELLRAMQQGSRLYSANILNGLANMVSYVGASPRAHTFVCIQEDASRIIFSALLVGCGQRCWERWG
jgi:hypothetical protein